jgi:peptidylprolyl isomerase/FKBP-type peptidyl-prolyl cis-trans isomerase FkpA
LKYVDIKVGTGTAAVSGDSLSVEYTGWLASTCTKFDSSYDSTSGTPGTPFTFSLGEGQVIPGWDDGLLGMKPGGIRRLYIPSALAYGSQGQQDQNGNTIIPANANLIFDVQVLSVTKK